MAKVNIKKLLLLTFGLVLIMVFGIRLLDPSLSAGQPENADLGIDSSYFKLFKEINELRIKQDLEPRQVSVLKRDPFVRPDAHLSVNALLPSGKFASSNALRQSDLMLSGILWGTDFTAAVINGEVVKVGNKVGQFYVKRILKRQVILSSPQGKIVLHLPDDKNVEQPSKKK